MSGKVTFPVFSLTLEEVDELTVETTVRESDSSRVETDNSIAQQDRDLFMPTAGNTVGLSCALCGIVEFEDVEQQREHFKLDWHRVNVKRRLKGLEYVTEEKFEATLDDLSSISGSGSDTDDDVVEIDGGGNSACVGTNNTLARPAKKSGVVLANEGKWVITRFYTPRETSYSVYTPLLTIKTKGEATQKELLDGLRALAKQPGRSLAHAPSDTPDTVLYKPTNQTWAVLLCSGGHFAAGVFDALHLRVHKSFHRYVVRKKQGGMQSVRDGTSGTSAPKSAGANLRRQQEAMLQEDVCTLLTDTWKECIAECSLVFVWAPNANEKFIYGSGGKVSAKCLKKSDPRVRRVPFRVRRPTLAETKRVHKSLCTVVQTVVEKTNSMDGSTAGTTPNGNHQSLTAQDLRLLENETKTISLSAASNSPGNGSSTAATSMIAHDSMSLMSHTSSFGSPMVSASPFLLGIDLDIRKELSKEHVQLFQVCEKGEMKELEILLREESANQNEIQDFDLNTVDLDFNTCLHLASKGSHPNIVWTLLQNGADPTVQNARGSTAYMLAKDKATRDMFRRFMALDETRWDYNKAGVPSALTEDMETAQAEKEQIKKAKQREKKKQLAKKKKERDREKALSKEAADKAQEEQDRIEAAKDAERKRIANLSDRERRALAAEARMKKAPGQSAGGIPTGETCSNDHCNTALMRGSEYERLKYKYCSVTCVSEHRKKLEA